MKYKNFQTCDNCGEKVPLYQVNCKNCHHFVRTTIVNIDLWSTIWKLIENPVEALKIIIFAQHKNFIFFLLIFLSLKFLLISSFFQSLLQINYLDSHSFILNVLLHVGIFSLFIILFSILMKIAIKFSIKSRLKDIIAVNIYSFMPVIFSLFIFTPIEYSIFGKHWFIFNPSPFLIKGFFAYIISLLELSLIIWSLLIFWKGLRLQLNSLFLSIVFLVIFLYSSYYLILNIPYILL